MDRSKGRADRTTDIAPPRVLVIIGGMGPGGAERQAQLLLCRMPRERAAMRLACFGGRKEDLDAVLAAGVPIDRLPLPSGSLWPVQLLLEMRKIVRRNRIEIVQSFLPTFDVVVPTLRPLTRGLRVVTSRRNVDEQLSPRIVRMLKTTNRWADRIVANSEGVAESVRQMEGDPGGKLRVIPNGIDLPSPITAGEREAARREHSCSDRAFAVLYMAHFRAGKGHRHLPRAIEAVCRRVPSAIFLLAGDVESNAEYRRNAASFRSAMEETAFADRARTLGVVAENRSLYAAADAVLNLSDWEGMSNALMEAMAFGVPVVASAAGGAREMIRDRADGFVVERGDGDAAARRLVELASDPELRGRMGEAGRSRIARDFSVERMVARYADLYRELVRR